jgi:hypothetical protein
LKALDELVRSDADLASLSLGHCQRFDMGIELAPLSSPVGADLFLSDNPAALRRFKICEVSWICSVSPSCWRVDVNSDPFFKIGSFAPAGQSYSAVLE